MKGIVHRYIGNQNSLVILFLPYTCGSDNKIKAVHEVRYLEKSHSRPLSS